MTLPLVGRSQHMNLGWTTTQTMRVLVAQSCLTLRPYGLWPARLLCLWNSPGKNTGVGSHSLLQGNLRDPEIEPGSPQQILR